MKTFKDIRLGDKIFTINTNSHSLLPSNDKYGNEYGQQVYFETTVNSIENIEGTYIVNPSSYDRSAFIKLAPNEINLTSLKRNDKLYLVDEDLKNHKLREIVLNAIKESEESIVRHKENMIGKIHNLRKTYYDLLSVKHYEL